MSTTVFILGATGFIGGETLAHLLSSPSTKSFSYSALVRSKEKASLLESLGVRSVIGTLDDASLLSAEAETADVVINLADADHLGACKAIIEGLGKRKGSPLYMHISGTAVMMDDGRGEYASDEIYSDLDTERIWALPDSGLHRTAEKLVLSAPSNVRTALISPGAVYGMSDNELVRKGISNSASIQIPMLVRISIARGQAGMVGKGKNIWPVVHVTDAASLIVTVLEAALAGKAATGREGYYCVESGEIDLYQPAAEVARVLHAKGIGKPEPKTFTEEEITKHFYGSWWFGANCRCRAERARQLGWKPTRTPKDFLAGISDEIDYIIKKDAEKK